jgi:hypothetical protein
MSNDNISQLVAIEAQVVAWKHHNHLLICWGIFAINDGLHVDLVKLQVLQCIICRFEQMSNDVLAQRSTLCKGLIKYNKTNDITPMTTHVQTTHPRWFA